MLFAFPNVIQESTLAQAPQLQCQTSRDDQGISEQPSIAQDQDGWQVALNRLSSDLNAKQPIKRADGSVNAKWMPLEVGQVVVVQQNSYRVKRMLGKGSYGCVWEADGPSGTVAIKEMCCGMQGSLPDANLQKLMFEVRLMQTFGPEERRAPRCLATQTKAVGWNEHVCHLVMTKLPGQPLSTSHLDPADFDTASRYACQMVSQLALTFDRLNHKFYHRDVCDRNVLADGDEFYLVDFGSAVDAIQWREGKWRSAHPTGDAKYWPPAAWRKILTNIVTHPRQYVDRLDMFALGVLALEVFGRRYSLVESRNANTALVVRNVSELWSEYLSLAKNSSAQLFAYSCACLRGGGDPRQQWNALLCSRIPERLDEALTRVVAALHQASLADLPPVSRVFAAVVRDMIWQKGQMKWSEVRTKCAHVLSEYTTSVARHEDLARRKELQFDVTRALASPLVSTAKQVEAYKTGGSMDSPHGQTRSGADAQVNETTQRDTAECSTENMMATIARMVQQAIAEPAQQSTERQMQDPIPEDSTQDTPARKCRSQTMPDFYEPAEDVFEYVASPDEPEDMSAAVSEEEHARTVEQVLAQAQVQEQEAYAREVEKVLAACAPIEQNAQQVEHTKRQDAPVNDLAQDPPEPTLVENQKLKYMEIATLREEAQPTRLCQYAAQSYDKWSLQEPLHVQDLRSPLAKPNAWEPPRSPISRAADIPPAGAPPAQNTRTQEIPDSARQPLTMCPRTNAAYCVKLEWGAPKPSRSPDDEGNRGCAAECSDPHSMQAPQNLPVVDEVAEQTQGEETGSALPILAGSDDSCLKRLLVMSDKFDQFALELTAFKNRLSIDREKGASNRSRKRS